MKNEKLDAQELWRLVDGNPALERISPEIKRNAIERISGSMYMDLREDLAFRYCFGQDKESLICLLNDILGENITDLEYLPNQVIGPNLDGKKPIMDVYCRTPSGEFICEMQNFRSSDFYDRLLYYGSTVIHSNLKPGDKYRFCPVHIVAFTNFERSHPAGVPEDRMTFTYHLREDECHIDMLTGSLAITLCELPRMKSARLEDARTPVEEWFVLFNNIANFAERPAALPKRLEGILGRAEFMNTDTTMIAQYIEHIVTQEQIENYTQPAYEDGLKKGVEIGMEKGREEGREEVARALMEQGFDPSVIAKCTGLTVEQIKQL